MQLTSSSDKLSAVKQKVHKLLWSSDTRKGISTSVFAHLAVAGVMAASMVSWSFPEDPIEFEEENLVAFNLGPQTDSEESSPIPEIAPPTAVEESTGPESDAPVEEVAFQEGGSGDEETIWTPPPPDEGTKPSDYKGVDEGKGKVIPEIDLIELPGEGVEPLLVSYDVGKFDGARALEEAARLQGEGRLKMMVVIDEEGIPIGCSIVDTSGSNVLDDLGCGLVMTYRYDPGKDSEGKPVQSMAYEMLEWSRASALDPKREGIRRAVADEADEEATETAES